MAGLHTDIRTIIILQHIIADTDGGDRQCTDRLIECLTLITMAHTLLMSDPSIIVEIT